MKDITAYIDENKDFIVDSKRAVEMDGNTGVVLLYSDVANRVYRAAKIKLIDVDRNVGPVYDVELTEDGLNLFRDTEYDIYAVYTAIGRFKKFIEYEAQS